MDKLADLYKLFAKYWLQSIGDKPVAHLQL